MFVVFYIIIAVETTLIIGLEVGLDQANVRAVIVLWHIFFAKRVINSCFLVAMT